MCALRTFCLMPGLIASNVKTLIITAMDNVVNGEFRIEHVQWVTLSL